MNPHVPHEVQKKWCNYDFIGIPFDKEGKQYIRARSHYFDDVHFYSFEDDWFWHDANSIPKEKQAS